MRRPLGKGSRAGVRVCGGKVRIGSLFSGIGGLELGLERAGVGETVWQVEIDPFCRKVLEKHWPEAKRYEDVRAVGERNLERVDLICGGFPCQDVSSAGKRAGLGGARSGLWYEYLRIVSEIRPEWVVVENVASGARAWVDAVLQGMGGLGYTCLPIPIGAVDVGAPHRRNRVFVIAYLDSAPDAHGILLRNEQGRSESERSRTSEPRLPGWWAETPQPGMVRVVHGASRGLDSARIKALGNAVVPQCAEVIGHVILELERRCSVP